MRLSRLRNGINWQVVLKMAKINWYKMRAACTVRSVLDLLLFIPVIIFLKTTVTCASVELRTRHALLMKS
jgi:hypothetical protein